MSLPKFAAYIKQICPTLEASEFELERAYESIFKEPQDMREGQLIYSPSVSRGGYTIVIKSGVPGIIIGYFPTEEAARFFCDTWNIKNQEAK